MGRQKDTKESVDRRIVQEYSGLLKKHGPRSPQTLKWGDRRTQYFRFKILTDIADLFGGQTYTVLDYGCGTGDLFEYLEFQGFKGTYRGIDINPALIAAAKKKYPGAAFTVAKAPAGRCDFCLISGVFNDKFYRDHETQMEQIKTTLRQAYKAARVGVALNGMSDTARTKNPNFFYIDAFALARWCAEHVSPYVLLRHDYRGGNFTLYLYRDKGVNF